MTKRTDDADECFGPGHKYSSFDDCVAKNSGKRNPRAYCAAIVRAVKAGKAEEAEAMLARLGGYSELGEQVDMLTEERNCDATFGPGRIFSEARIDRRTNLLSNVILLGKHSANGRTYSDRAMNDAVRLYEGTGFYIDHPPQSELRDRKGVRSVHDLAGRITNPRIVGASVRGDIELLDREPHKSLVFALAEQMPSMVGNSHRAEGTIRQENGTQVVESLDKVYGVELVTDPATVNGLFESIQHDEDDMKTATLEQLKKERPDLVKAVLAEAKGQTDAESLKAENTELKKKVDTLEAKEKERTHQAMVDEKLAEAKLPQRLITDLFKEQLKAAEDDKAVDKLIAERKEIAKGMTSTGPVSFERNLDKHTKDAGEKKPIDESKIVDYGKQLGLVA